MKIAYFPAGAPTWPSSRLRVYRIAEALKAMGHSVSINPTSAKGFDAAVVQKRFDLHGKMNEWRQAGVRVIWDVDDRIPGGPVEAADVVTIGAEALRELYPMGVYIPDALDLDDHAVAKGRHAEAIELVGWVGMAENLYHAAPVAEATERLGLTLVVITDMKSPAFTKRYHRAEYWQWSLDTVDRDLVTCDVIACPYVLDGPWPAAWVASKGENRVYKAWALGLPVIGTPIPSYVAAGLVHQATTAREWTLALKALGSREAREKDARRGQAIALSHVADRVAEQWLRVMQPADEAIHEDTADGQ